MRHQTDSNTNPDLVGARPFTKTIRTKSGTTLTRYWADGLGWVSIPGTESEDCHDEPGLIPARPSVKTVRTKSGATLLRYWADGLGWVSIPE